MLHVWRQKGNQVKNKSENDNNQVSANQGPNSTFAVEANIKSLCLKLSRGSILKFQSRVYTKQ